MTAYNEKEFVKDFFLRTKYNLDLYNIKLGSANEEFKYETTQLINSFLGLIVFVKVDGVQSSNELKSFMGKNMPDEWKYQYHNAKKPEKYRFGSYLRHIRNAVSHCEITANVNDEKEIVSIRFIDKEPAYYKYWNSKNIFNLVLSLEAIVDLVDLLLVAIGAQSIDENKSPTTLNNQEATTDKACKPLGEN